MLTGRRCDRCWKMFTITRMAMLNLRTYYCLRCVQRSGVKGAS